MAMPSGLASLSILTFLPLYISPLGSVSPAAFLALFVRPAVLLGLLVLAVALSTLARVW